MSKGTILSTTHPNQSSRSCVDAVDCAASTACGLRSGLLPRDQIGMSMLNYFKLSRNEAVSPRLLLQ